MRALIVDDSRSLREHFRRHLERLGGVCEEARNGQEALDALAADESFDLMLVDLYMPVMNGLECVKRLRSSKLSPALKVMMVTTEADTNLISRALESGVDEFLMKPFTLEGLRQKMLILGFVTAA